MADRTWKKVSSEKVYEDMPFFWITRDRVIQPDGQPGTYSVLHGHGAVFVIAKTSTGKLIFINQFRYPVGTNVVEAVAGGLDEGQDPLEQAKNELHEEIGATAAEFTWLGELQGSPSRQNTKIQVVLAEGIDEGKVHLEKQEGNEAINGIYIWRDAEVVGKIRNGTIRDAATVACLNLYWAHYGYPKAD